MKNDGFLHILKFLWIAPSVYSSTTFDKQVKQYSVERAYEVTLELKRFLKPMHIIVAPEMVVDNRHNKLGEKFVNIFSDMMLHSDVNIQQI